MSINDPGDLRGLHNWTQHGIGGAPSRNVHYVYSKDQLASELANINDNLIATTLTGTVSVTNGSPTITFSSAPADNKVVAGRSLFTVDGSRFYQLKNGPSTNGGAVFTLLENYQGSTNAAAAFTIYEPNPHSIVLMPGIYDYTNDALAQNITLKPYVSMTALDRASTIIRRNKNNSTPTLTPIIGVFHGCELSNFTIDSVDGHFNIYRMGLSAYATSQTQAMKGSRWVLRNLAMLNKDPNFIDSGADYVIDSSYYNSDELILEDCLFEHCWDGFTWNTSGSGRLNVKFIRPKIWKTPIPKSGSTQSGAAFIRAGVTGASTTDLVIESPIYDQVTYAAAEVVDDGFGGVIANLSGTYGFLVIGNGATAKVNNPSIDMDVGINYGRCAAMQTISGSGTCKLEINGGRIKVLGAGDAGATVAAVQGLTPGAITIQGTDIEAVIGVRNNAASGTLSVRGGSRVSGSTNSAVQVAGTLNASPNADLIGATSGSITAAAT